MHNPPTTVSLWYQLVPSQESASRGCQNCSIPRSVQTLHTTAGTLLASLPFALCPGIGIRNVLAQSNW
jgi:hypothetical protein